MSIKFFWRCESETLDGTDDYSAGDTTATATGTPSISASGVKVGTNGLVTVDTTDYYSFDSASIVTVDQGSCGYWIQYKTSVPISALNVGVHFRNSADPDDHIGSLTGSSQEQRLSIRKTGAVATIIATTVANLAIDTWYFVVFRWHISADKRAIEVYDSSLTLIDSTEDLATDLAAFTPTTIDTIRIGNNSSHGNPVWMDNVMISDTYGEDLTSYANYTSYTQFTSIPWQQLYRRPNTLLRM